MKRSLSPVAGRAVAALAACAAAWPVACADGPPGAGAADELPFRAVADPQTLMLAVIEPAAETYWDAVGVIVDLDGEHRIEPRTDEEWEAVTSAAYLLAESGNLLLAGDRALRGGHWQAMSRAMIDVGERAVAAAESRDPEGVFEAGGDVYLVCTGCHAVYATETLRPSYGADEPGAGADRIDEPGRDGGGAEGAGERGASVDRGAPDSSSAPP